MLLDIKEQLRSFVKSSLRDFFTTGGTVDVEDGEVEL